MSEQLPTYALGEPGPMRDRLVAAVLGGHKTATSWLQVFYQMEGLPLPRPGERFRLIDSSARPVGVVETIRADVVRFADVRDDVAQAEGQGFTNHDDWRAVHFAYWDRFRDQVRAFLGDPGWTIGDDTPVVVERFRHVA